MTYSKLLRAMHRPRDLIRSVIATLEQGGFPSDVIALWKEALAKIEQGYEAARRFITATNGRN